MESILSLFIVTALIAAAGAQTDASMPKMVEVGKAVAESRPAELTRANADFEKALKEVSLTPSPSIRAEVKALQSASIKLLTNLGDGKFSKNSGEAKAVAIAVKSTLDKLDYLIVENYQEQIGVANIIPPPGTSNAAAGMPPHAITDPKLRQQYEDAIENERAKQEKNAQQRELRTTRKLILMNVVALESWRSATGLSKEGLIETFTSEGKSRELLRDIITTRYLPIKKIQSNDQHASISPKCATKSHAAILTKTASNAATCIRATAPMPTYPSEKTAPANTSVVRKATQAHARKKTNENSLRSGD